jgi:hypothetical protein
MKPFEVGDIVTIRGKSQKGKTRVSQFGDTWKVVCFNDDIVARPNGGRCMCVVPATGVAWARWMAIENDKDFEVVET